MNRIDISVQPSYPVLLGENILQKGLLENYAEPHTKWMIVTDKFVAPFYLRSVREYLTSEGFDAYEFIMDAGEKAKNFQTYFSLCESLAHNKFHRKDTVVALGGGVVGDLAGFVASTYMRGISFVQIPTTYLAMLDSSVGGKTAVDLPAGKNMIGTFYQPKLVLMDTLFLGTLPDKEWKNGTGEAIKYCFLDPKIYSLYLENKPISFIEACVKLKGDIVAKDEKDHGARKILNLGHTVGHAVERLSGYEIPHGECVAQGLYACIFSAHRAGKLSDGERKEMQRILQNAGFDYHIPFSKQSVMQAIYMDKKAEQNTVTFIECNGIGKCEPRSYSFEDLEKYLSF